MLFTTAEVIQIAKISQYLSTNDIAKAGLSGGGMDIQLPRKIYSVRKNVEWKYDLDQNASSLDETGKYLYALCGKYGLQAQNVVGVGGAVSPVSPSTVPDPYDFEVSGSSFVINGQSSITIEAFVGYNLLFIRGNIPQSQVNQGGSYFSWDRDTGLFTCSPAAVSGELFQLYPFL